MSLRDGAPHAEGSDSDAATASDALATATAGGALAARYTAGMDSGDETEAAAAAEAAAAHLVSAPPSEEGPAAEPPKSSPAKPVSDSAGGGQPRDPSDEHALDHAQAANIDSAAVVEAERSRGDENELHRLKIALQADDMKVKAGSAGTLDNEARTEPEASVEKRAAGPLYVSLSV